MSYFLRNDWGSIPALQGGWVFDENECAQDSNVAGIINKKPESHLLSFFKLEIIFLNSP